MDSVLVLLSTYNGERYLNEQLSSIFTQKDVDISILVRDDGSTDSTLSILAKYADSHPNKIFILKGKNIGWKDSFLKLVDIAGNSYTKFDYYAFSDQDDIWENDKVLIGVTSIKSQSKGPLLYCSNLYFFRDGVNMGEVYNHLPEPTYKNCLIRNIAAGCTMVFNKDLIDIIKNKKPLIQVAHDFWVYQIAVLCGHVIVDPKAHILYRQHSNNQIGSPDGKLEVWERRLSTLITSMRTHQRENQAKELRRLFSDFMKPEAIAAIDIIANYRANVISKIKLLFDNQYSTGLKSNDFWLKFRILFSGI